MNYSAIFLNKKNYYIENDAIKFTFQVYDEQNNLVSDLSTYKFAFRITNDANVKTKYDANYSGGSASQISVSSDKVTVHIIATDTADYYGTYIIELQMTRKLDTTFVQTIYRGLVEIIEEELDV